MATWLKLVGATDDPMPDVWLTSRTDLREEVGFSKKANVDVGEDLVLYAIPQRKIIGLAKVVSHPQPSDDHERWPWRSKIKLTLAIADYARAPDLDEISEAGDRDLSKSVQRQSHIELTWDEFARARDLLKAAYDPSQGDLLA
jgi:hypothetical protein